MVERDLVCLAWPSLHLPDILNANLVDHDASMLLGVNDKGEFADPIDRSDQLFAVQEGHEYRLALALEEPVLVMKELLAVDFFLADLYRSEEHTSELQSLRHLVCRLLL